MNHKENNFSISFSSNNYVNNTDRKIYEYKLEGFSKEWSKTNGNTVVFTNIPPGKYKLVIREQQQNLLDEIHAIELPILIHHPWWNTWWMWILYLCTITVIGWNIFSEARSKMQLRASLAQEKLEKEKNEELIQAKLQFFANISHEFRTPLTLIIAQLEALLQVNSLSPFLRSRLTKNLQKHIPVQRADLRATGFPEDGTWETASKRLPNGPHPLLETNSSRFHRPSELTEYTVHIPYRSRKLVVLVRWTTIEESPHQSTFQCL